MPPAKQMRLESDKHLVQIVTIHKSKGLEYPLVSLHLLTNFTSRSRRFITIATRLRQFWILMLRQKASTSRRPNVWRKKMLVCFTWR